MTPNMISAQQPASAQPGAGPARLPGLFDILGPVMVGPSSSHTAGVLRLGLMARGLLGGQPRAVEMGFFGALTRTYKGHMSDSAIVAGLLGYPEDSPQIKDALNLAEEQGLKVSYKLEPDSNRNPNTVRLVLTPKSGPDLTVTGISLGGGEIVVTELDGFPLSLRGNENGFLMISDRELSAEEISAAGGPALTALVKTVKEPSSPVPVMHQAFTADPLPQAPAELDKLQGVKRLCLIPRVLDYDLICSEPLCGSLAEAERLCREQNLTLPELAVRYEEKRSGLSPQRIYEMTARRWEAMKDSVAHGLAGPNCLLAGFASGDDGAAMLRQSEKKCFSGPLLSRAVAGALAVMEQNGCMGCVVASPTAGSCGVIAGALTALRALDGRNDEELIKALLGAALVGAIISQRVPMSGALGGCQAEIGIAAAMGASALVILAGGRPAEAIEATALTLKNFLGLICDPVAGPVEVPCIKRNAVGTASAFIHADMALAGIKSVIPPDEVISAMLNVQALMPASLRGTLEGGLPSTKTGRELDLRWAEILGRKARNCTPEVL